jgi:hypothetical protein
LLAPQNGIVLNVFVHPYLSPRHHLAPTSSLAVGDGERIYKKRTVVVGQLGSTVAAFYGRSARATVQTKDRTLAANKKNNYFFRALKHA